MSTVTHEIPVEIQQQWILKLESLKVCFVLFFI